MYMSTHCNYERSCDLHCLASDVQQRFNVEIVGSQDDLKEHFLVDIDEFGVPIANLGGTLSGLFRFIGRGRRIAAVMGAIFQYLEDVRDSLSTRIALTFFSTLLDTFTRGMGASESPKSSSMVLISIERSATSRSTVNTSLSDVESCTMLCGFSVWM